MAKRDAILEGTLAAQRLHAQLGTRKAIECGELSHIDVFRVAIDLGAKLLFRPLKGLLGAYLGMPDYPVPGIMVSTQRDLHVQRFTAAHELGHLCLGHTMPSLDNQVGLWRSETKDLGEIAADAFASEFMLPKWLYVHHAARQRWKSVALHLAENTYQLSLRLGASYEATCWGLRGHGILDQNTVNRLRTHEPKDLKRAALGALVEMANPWADVWVITEADDGLKFEGGPDDIVVFRCRERASAGYLWDETRLPHEGFEVLLDSREESEADQCGSDVTRVLVTRVRQAGEYRVVFSERRPWYPEDSLTTLSVAFDLQGIEEGMSRTALKAMVAA